MASSARPSAPARAAATARGPRARARRPVPPIGSHLPVGAGLVRGAFRTAVDIGAEALQVFVGNPRGWARAAGDPEQDEAFRSRCADAGIRVFVHTPYLVNFGSPTPATLERSADIVAHNLVRAYAIGAEGVVVHTGSGVAEGSREVAMRQVRESLLPILDALPDGAPTLLLEPTAGQGQSLCSGVDDLPAYLAALDDHPRLGICLDTCHVFTAGAPLDTPGGTTATLDRLVALAGADRLRLVHANDSKDPRGSFRDRHERIGQGHIGAGAFEELLRHPAVAGVPVVVETPGGVEASREDIAALKRARGR
ncbi:deoxyribonuclease-4 [Actinopolymorpha cephalotaxi]|uniref:Probable endonuclease 4 n=1 Tax=Actinopolymorpha cephalotaxi TaxID=504797 RepID=A0A1I2WDD5_9ACTN|nr:deoxyribonuclease IV [Actinopolymorpha cephalotaxi]NYH82657.1 deoxyribonuclease-4 [Actinopolymorpha cephalotaxi]SFG98729.1 deoxyribonuclease-4 [Actinopolymorpha cephalotaxi]